MKRFSNSEIVVIAKWMVRTRLLETLCEPEGLSAFDRAIKCDFAELMESGEAAFAEARYDRQEEIRISIHFSDCRYEFGAAVEKGAVRIDRRSDYFEA